MSFLADREIRHFFIELSCLCAGLTVLAQLWEWHSRGGLSPALLIASLLFSAALLLCAASFFTRQQRRLDKAARELERFAAGDTAARLDSDSEGSMAKLFHGVNQLATGLSAGQDQTQREKLFMRDTLSDISHQLKTPLAALEIYISLLQEERGDPESVLEFAVKSERELERIEALVQNLLKITRLDSGSVTMDMQEENVSDMLSELYERFSVRADMEGKSLTLSGPEDICLPCDRVWLTEAVGNIIKNALDHTGKGGRIELRWSSAAAFLRVSVSDNGSGIHQEDIHHIFKRFYRSRFSKDTQGSGLGLPLAKAIVEAHGGVIEAESELGQGSSFTISLPMAYTGIN